MLEEPTGRWATGLLERPFGRGMNLEIAVADLAPILDGLARIGWPPFEGVTESWYRAGGEETGNREFLVQDPDGWLLRFAVDLGRRPAPRAAAAAAAAAAATAR